MILAMIIFPMRLNFSYNISPTSIVILVLGCHFKIEKTEFEVYIYINTFSPGY